MAVQIDEKPGAASGPRKAHWRKSLFVRVIILCAVLLLCLLGAVGAMCHYYVNAAAMEMTALSEEVARRVQASLEAEPGLDGAGLEARLRPIARWTRASR